MEVEKSGAGKGKRLGRGQLKRKHNRRRWETQIQSAIDLNPSNVLYTIRILDGYRRDLRKRHIILSDVLYYFYRIGIKPSGFDTWEDHLLYKVPARKQLSAIVAKILARFTDYHASMLKAACKMRVWHYCKTYVRDTGKYTHENFYKYPNRGKMYEYRESMRDEYHRIFNKLRNVIYLNPLSRIEVYFRNYGCGSDYYDLVYNIIALLPERCGTLSNDAVRRYLRQIQNSIYGHSPRYEPDEHSGILIHTKFDHRLLLLCARQHSEESYMYRMPRDVLKIIFNMIKPDNVQVMVRWGRLKVIKSTDDDFNFEIKKIFAV